MQFLFSILRQFFPLAHAGALETAGTQHAGVQAMWNQIKSILMSGASPEETVGFFAQRVVDFIFTVLGGLVVALVIYGSIRIIYSQGKDEEVTQGKTVIYYALGGLVLALIAVLVIDFMYGVVQGIFFL